jgi:glycerol-3-phosphate O-acyltransferase
MKFQLAILSLFCGGVAAFVPQPLNSRAVAAAPTSSNGPLFSTAAPAEAESTTDSDSGLSPEFQAALDKAVATCKGVLEKSQPELVEASVHFCTEYMTASYKSHAKNPLPETSAMASLERILSGVKLAYAFGMGEDTYTFGVSHEAIRGDCEESKKIGSDLDFYSWGVEFFRYFMDMENSVVLGEDNLAKAVEQIRAGENVVFYANHQSEADPQVMSVMLEKCGYKKEASDMVFVAGHKVTTDALAVPFSMGRNLICIHSKKHIDVDPETKPFKTRQNMKAMSGMLGRLKAGGCMIWVAPSGGRDRRDTDSGKTPIAPFDEKTIGMFRLMGKKSKVTTHFYPISMVSYELCPPPDFIEADTGEQRNFRFVPVGIACGPEVDGESDEAFSPGVFEEAKKGYHELREKIFPGSSPYE